MMLSTTKNNVDSLKKLIDPTQDRDHCRQQALLSARNRWEISNNKVYKTTAASNESSSLPFYDYY